MTDLWTRGAGELAAMIAARETTSVEIVTAHLKRIDELNPALNAYTAIFDDALERAERADAATAGGELGPLHGVPVSLKDNIDVAGRASVNGIAEYREILVDADAPLVTRLRRAGAIPLGHTNVPDQSTGWHADNAVFGATRNPWDADRTPGGSSGGEAAAIAAGMSPLGFGGDTGGSIRLPALWCGIAGLKPSHGLVPRFAQLDPAPSMFDQLMSVSGPMARCIDDLRLALRVLATGPDPLDPWSVTAPARPSPSTGRVLVIEPSASAPPAVRDAVRVASDALAAAGYRIATAPTPSLERSTSAYWTLASTEGQARRPRREGVPKATLSPIQRQFYATYGEVHPPRTVDELVDAWAIRLELAREWAAVLDDGTLVLGAAAECVAFPTADYCRDGDWMRSFTDGLDLCLVPNLIGTPAVSVPTGVVDGLPAGVQVMGAKWDDERCLAAADAIERAVGTFTPVMPR
jgi:amidase